MPASATPADGVVLKPVTFWARGERNIGGVLPLIVLTNCDEVELRYGNFPPKRIAPDRERFPHLPHAPVIVDQPHFTNDELGLWGMTWEPATITGFLDGKPVATVRVRLRPGADDAASRARCRPRSARNDAVRVMVRALDQAGNKLPFFLSRSPSPSPARPAASGPPWCRCAPASTGFWVQAFAAGEIVVTVSSDRLGTQEIRVIAAHSA